MGGLKLLAEGPLDASSESPRPARRARQWGRDLPGSPGPELPPDGSVTRPGGAG